MLTTYQTSQSFDASDRDQDGAYPYCERSFGLVQLRPLHHEHRRRGISWKRRNRPTTRPTRRRGVGPVVINEINYNPSPGQTAYIELKNITTQASTFTIPTMPTR